MSPGPPTALSLVAATASLFVTDAASADPASAAVSCVPDPRLTDAAAELLLTGKAPDSQQLVAAVRAAGSEAVAPRALFLPSDDPARIASWLTDVRAKADIDLVCGEARSERARLLIASARAATLRIDGTTVRGTIAASYVKPELVFRSADGTLTRMAVTRDELEHGVQLDPEWRAVQVQLLASGRNGPRPVAERTLARAGADADIDDHLELSSEAPLDANGIADVVGQLRTKHGSPTLRRNRLADGIARDYAKEVCAQGRVVHELEPGVNPEVRVARAGLKAKLTGEAVARAADANAALKALWQSPSHSLTLLERRFTDVGIGVANDDQQRACVVVLLLSWPRPIPRASAGAAN